jgi:hypothetical protein
MTRYRNHRAAFDNVRRYPGMYFSEVRFDVVAAFIQGFDAAYEGGVLIGFKEWIVLRLGYGTNLYWVPLVLDAAFPDQKPGAMFGVSLSAADEKKAIDKLFELLDAFEHEVDTVNKLSKIFVDYTELVRR